MNKKKNIYLMALLPFLVVALLYEIIPLLMVIRNSFQSDTGAGITLENYQTIAEKLLYQKAIVNSLTNITDIINRWESLCGFSRGKSNCVDHTRKTQLQLFTDCI